MGEKPEASQTIRRRYPGTGPFSDSAADQARFFGREDAADQLYLRVLSVPLVVQFGKSGLGKTSLLQAGLFPRLRKRAYLPVMIRLNVQEESLLEATKRSMRESCEAEGLQFAPGDSTGVWELLATTAVWRDDFLLTPVLVFDQFEEVFTLRDAAFRAAMAAEIGALARGAPPSRDSARQSGGKPVVKIVISLREDHLGELEELSAAIPGLFHERLRLEPFTRETAKDPILKPAALEPEQGEEPYWSPRFTLDESALTAMLDFLEGESGVIEPFQLQLLSRHAEVIARRNRGKAKDGVVTLTKDDLAGAQQFEAVLRNFYHDTLDKIPSSAQRRRAAKLCEYGLLSDSGHRLMLEESQVLGEYHVSDDTLAILCTERLLTREKRHRSFFYEIGHDRLAESVFNARTVKLPKNVRRFLWTAFAVSLGIIVGLAIYSSKIKEAGDAARVERNNADALIGFLLGEQFLGEIRDTGRSMLLGSVADRIHESGSVDRDPLNRGLALRNNGDIDVVNGRVAASIERFRAALPALEDASKNAAVADLAQRELARTHERLADQLSKQGHLKEALQHSRAAESAWRRVINGRHCAGPLTKDCVELANTMLRSANLKHAMGEADIAAETNEAFRLSSEVLFGAGGATGSPQKASPYPDPGAVGVLSALGVTRTKAYGFFEDAAGAAALAVASSELRPQSVEARVAALEALMTRGIGNFDDDPQKALDDYREAVRRGNELRHWDPNNRAWLQIWAEHHLLISNAILLCNRRDRKYRCQSSGSIADAEAGTLEALGQLRALAGLDPSNVDIQNDLMWALQIHASVLGEKGLQDDSLAHLSEAQNIYRNRSHDESDVASEIRYAILLRDIADRFAAMNRPADAAANLQQSDDVLQKLLKMHPGHDALLNELSKNRTSGAALQRRQGNAGAAAALDAEAIRLTNAYVAVGQVGDERHRLTAVDKDHFLKGNKLLDSNPAAALREFLQSEATAREIIRLRPADPLGYSSLQLGYAKVCVAQHELKNVDGEAAAMQARLNAAQLAAWFVPTANENNSLLDARNEFARFLFLNDRPEESLAMVQEVVVVAERMAQSPNPSPQSLALLGHSQCNLGEVKFKFKMAGWEEAMRSGLIHIEAAARQSKKADLYTMLGEWRLRLAKKLDVGKHAQEALTERATAKEAFRTALRIDPNDAAARDGLEKVEADPQSH